MYSQNNEEQIILNYFSGKKGTFLDIGANDGVTLSNVRALAELGWKGILVEPSLKSYNKCLENYKDFKKVKVENCAIGIKTERAKFYESGEHLGNGDYALLSSLNFEETKRWTKETFTETEVNVLTWNDFKIMRKVRKFDFITIDAEGLDLEILKQINLKQTKTQMVCVEHNGKNIDKYIEYCEKFGMKSVLFNHENIIMAL
jgi:FkbM family methyltransferase